MYSPCSSKQYVGLLDPKAWVRIPGQSPKVKCEKYFFGDYLLQESRGIITPKSLTYARNVSLQPFRQDYVLASNTIYVVCVNYILECRDLQFKVTSKRRFFSETFLENFLFTFRGFCQKIVERKSPQKYFFIFRLVEHS